MHVTTTAADTGPMTGVDAVSSTSEVQPSLRGRALRASAWVLASKPLGMSIQLLRSLILTRLLFPEAFGLMALVGVVIQGLAMCSDVGIGPNIVQSRRGDDAKFLQTAWTLQIVRGFCLWLICCGLAWPVALFYGQPMLASLLPVAGLAIVIGGFNTTAWATHDRDMKRGRLTIIAYSVQLANLIVMIAAAWALRSVWALVIGSLSGNVLNVMLGHLFLPGVRHRFRWEREAVRELVSFGKWIFISTLLTFFAMQMDKLMLGKLISTELLGIYAIALVLANLPRELVQQISSLVLFPALAEKFRVDRRQMHDRLARARGVVLRVGLLLTVGMGAIAPAFFGYLYDPRYEAAGWIAQVLAVSVWMTVLNASTGYALLALGDSRALATGNLFNVLVTVVAALAGFQWFGLAGFIIGYAAGTASGEFVQGMWLRRYGIGVLRQDAAFTLIGLVCGAAVLLVVQAVKQMGTPLQPWMGALIGLAVWTGLVAALVPQLKRELAPQLSILPYIGLIRRSWSHV